MDFETNYVIFHEMIRSHPISTHFILESKILKHLITNFHFVKKTQKSWQGFIWQAYLYFHLLINSHPYLAPAVIFFIPTGTMSPNGDCGKRKLRNFIFLGVKTMDDHISPLKVWSFSSKTDPGIGEAVAQSTKMIEKIQKKHLVRLTSQISDLYTIWT